MTRKVFLAPELAADSAELPAAGTALRVPDSAAHHMRVMRIGAGEEIDLVDGAGLRLTCRASGTGDDLALDVLSAVREAQADPELVLVQALAKGDRDLQALEAAVEIGADRIVPWAAQRSIADWPAKRAEKSHRKWASAAAAAAQQSRRAFLPAVDPLVRGTGVVAALRDDDLVLVLHEDAEDRLADVLAAERPAAHPRIVLLVGPEGGIAPAEIDALTAAGARTVLLGPTVLRASSAGPAGLVLCQAALGRWASRRVD